MKQYKNMSLLLVVLSYSGVSQAMASRSTQAIRPVVQRGMQNSANRGFVSMTTPEFTNIPAYRNMTKLVNEAESKKFEQSQALDPQMSAFDALKDNPFAQVMFAKDQAEFALEQKDLDRRKFESDVAYLQKFIKEAEVLKKDIIDKKEVLKNNEGMNIPTKIHKDIVLPLRSERIKGYKNAQILQDMQNKKEAYDEGLMNQYRSVTPAEIQPTVYYRKWSGISNLRDKNLDVEAFALSASIDTAKNLLEEIKADEVKIAEDNKKIVEQQAALKHALENPMFKSAGGTFQLKGLPSTNQSSKGSNEIAVKESFDPRVDELD